MTELKGAIGQAARRLRRELRALEAELEKGPVETVTLARLLVELDGMGDAVADAAAELDEHRLYDLG